MGIPNVIRPIADNERFIGYSIQESRPTTNGNFTLVQLVVAISIPTTVAMIGVMWSVASNNRLSDRVDRQTENFNNQVTTLLTTIHGVDVRVVKLEEKSKRD